MKRHTRILSVGVLAAGLLLAQCSMDSAESLGELYQYDESGRLIGTTLSGHEQLEFTYDENSRLTTMAGDGVEARIMYNDHGDPVMIEDHSGSTQHFYDVFGRPAGAIWKHSPGHVIDYWFDSFGRLKRLSVYNYERVREIDYYRDLLDELERDAEEVLSSSNDRQRQFNEMMHRLRSETELERSRYLEYTVGYRYDQFGNLTRVELEDGDIEYHYSDDFRRIERRLPNDINSTYQYEEHGWLKSLEHRKSGTLVASYEYGYDPSGRPIRIDEYDGKAQRTIETTWDDNGFLSSIDHGDASGILEFEYSPDGRRLSVTDQQGVQPYEYDKFGQLQRTDHVELKRNSAGRVQTIAGPDIRTELEYDGRGFLKGVSTDATDVELGWDISGHLISIDRNGEISHFVPDLLSTQGVPLAEFDDDGGLKAAFFYGNEMVGRRSADNRTEYFLEDGFGRVRLRVGTSGDVVDRTDWSAFGWPSSADIPVPFTADASWIIPETRGLVKGGSLYMPGHDCVQRTSLIADHVSVDQHRPLHVEQISARELAVGRLGQFRTFGIYNPFEDPGQVLLHYARIPLGGWLGIYINLLLDTYDVMDPRHGGAADVTYPVSLAYTGTAILMQAGKLLSGSSASYFSYSAGLASAPLMWTPLLQGVLDAYWGLVFGYFDLAGRQMEMAKFQRMYPRDLYDIKVDGNVTRIRRRKPGETGWRMPPVSHMPQEQQARTKTPEHETTIDIDKDDSYRNDDERSVPHDDLHADDQEPESGPPSSGPCPPFCGPCPPFCGGGGGPCPPFCGDGGDGGDDGGSSRTAIPGLADPFESIQDQLGGVSLDVDAVFSGDLGHIEAAVYDREQDCLVLIGDGERTVSGIRPDDMAVALLCINGFDTIPPQSPEFTLDPNDPLRVDGDLLKAKYFPRLLVAPTEFGRTMFETDYLMKQYSFGVELDSEGNLQNRENTVPGLQDLAEIWKGMPDVGPSRNRLWLVPDTLHLSEDGNCILFGKMSFHVNTRRQVVDKSSPSGLSDVGDETDPVAFEFARQFAELYDSVALREPQFERLKQLGRTVGLAKWLRRAGVPHDELWAVNEINSHRIAFCNTVGAIRTHRYSAAVYDTVFVGNTRTISGGQNRTSLFGGVDLDVPIVRHTTPRVGLLARQVKSMLSGSTGGPVFPLEFEGRNLVGFVMPSTASGRRFWSDPREIVVSGVTYTYGQDQRIIASKTQDGAVRTYEYDVDGRLTTVTSTSPAGNLVHVKGRRLGDGSCWDMTDKDGNATRLLYGPDGYLRESIFNGRHLTDYQNVPVANRVTLETDGLIEEVVLDPSGRVVEYRQEDATVGRQAPLAFSYSDVGSLQSMSLDGRTIAQVTFAADGMTPERLELPQGDIEYRYDESDRPVSITTSWGDRVTCEYSGDRISRIGLHGAGRKMTLELHEDGSARLIDPQGRTSRLSFSNDQLVAVESDEGGTRIKVERDGRGYPTRLDVSGKPSISVTYRDDLAVSARVDQPVMPILAPSSGGRRNRAAGFRRTPSTGERREDLLEASRLLQEAMIVDLDRDDDGEWNLLVADGSGDVRHLDPSAARELAQLLDRTTGGLSEIDEDIQMRWGQYIRDHLGSGPGISRWVLADGRSLKYKPILILRTAHVQGPFTNLEQVRALSQNFVLFGTSSAAAEGQVGPTPATDLVRKISSVPDIVSGNTLFVIRVPPALLDAESGLPVAWERAITSLEDEVGKENVVLDPSKERFMEAIAQRGRDIVAIDIMHTEENGLPMTGGDICTAGDVKQGRDLSHIKYMITGPFSCELHLRQGGELEKAFRSKGVGLINGHSGKIPASTVLLRLELLIDLIGSGILEGVPAYYVPDLLEQLEPAEQEGMINIGYEHDSETLLCQSTGLGCR